MKDILDFIEKTVDYLEANIMGAPSLDDVSENVYVSKYHALRLFKEITGMGIMEYLTKRRLSSSLSLLLSARQDIGFVANQYGFGGKESYIKAFKKLFGITPDAYRKNPRELRIYERYNTELLRRCGEGCVVVPEIKIVPGFCVAGVEYDINAAENMYKAVGIAAAKDFFLNSKQLIKNAVSYTKYIGYGHTPTYFTEIGSAKQTILYMPSLIVNEESELPESMKKRVIDTKKYAIFKYMGLHSIWDISGQDIFDIWEYILFVWLPTVKYEHDGYCCFEYIDFELCGDDYCEISFYISVVLGGHYCFTAK